MNNVILAIFGTVSLGLLIGWLTRYVLFRAKPITIKGLAGIICVVFGGTITKMLSGNMDLVWWYVLGLLAGFIVYSVLGFYARKRESYKNEFAGILYDEETSEDAGKSTPKND